MESHKFSLKKTVAAFLLAPPTLALIGFCWSFGIRVAGAIERSIRNEAEIAELRKEIKQEVREIHWFLIKRKNIHVPPTIHQGDKK